MPDAPQDRKGFQVAIVCALPLEAENVQSVFDVCWEDQGQEYDKAEGDQNSYTTGVIGKHNVVLVHLPEMGSNSASFAVAGLKSSFPNINLVLVAGICGVVPVNRKTKQQIVLGDVVISTGMVQYDFGRQYPDVFERKKETEDTLGRARPEIRSFLSKWQTRQNLQRLRKSLGQLIHSDEFHKNVPSAAYPGTVKDRLYRADYVHQHRSSDTCDRCLVALGTCRKDCDELECEDHETVIRNKSGPANEHTGPASTYTPSIHLGIFGSANTVMKSGLDRDRIANADDLIAFEMEGAGFWEQYPTIVIKAACDYADSHKNKEWQDYAAAMSAACLKVLLREWMATEQPVDEDKSPGSIWFAPFDPMPGFVGREKELKILEEKLLDRRGNRMVSILGLGGIGKSRLAIECASAIKTKHPEYSVFWVQASKKLTFEKDMLEIGKSLRIHGIEDGKADVTKLVTRYLDMTGKWLFVLDNADDESLWGVRPDLNNPQTSLVHCLPRTATGSILVTTRTSQVASFLTQEKLIILNAMPRAEAVELFESKVQSLETEIDRESLLILVDKLAYLPLAIVQAASYVYMTRITIQTYLRLLDASEVGVVKLLSKDFGDPTRYPDAVNPVANTWLVSFQQIERDHPLAADFLSSMACFDGKGIPQSLLIAKGQNIDEIDIVDAIAVLMGYSFVTQQTDNKDVSNTEKTYDMHRLVWLAARNWLKMSGSFSNWMKRCTIQLAQSFPIADYENKSIWTMLLPHAQRIHESDELITIPEQCDLLELMAICFCVNGKYDGATKLVEAAVDWREKVQGASDPETLEAYAMLGQTMLQRGSFLEAERCLEKAFRGYLEAVGADHSLTIMIKGELAQVFRAQGRFSEAETTLREVLHSCDRSLDGSNQLTRINSLRLATTLGEQGKYSEAASIYREILSVYEETLGKSHPNTVQVMNNLAVILLDQQNYTEAEVMLRQALNSNEKVLGRSHPVTLTSMQNLAVALKHQGNHTEAEAMLREALRSNEVESGKSHPQTLLNLSNLATILRRQKNDSEAETMLRQALKSNETVLGRSHPQTLMSMHNLAFALAEQKNYTEAEAIFRQLLDSSETVLGKSHPNTLKSINSLACALKDQGRDDEARSLMDSCLKAALQAADPSDDIEDYMATWKAWTGEDYIASQQEIEEGDEKLALE